MDRLRNTPRMGWKVFCFVALFSCSTALSITMDPPVCISGISYAATCPAIAASSENRALAVWITDTQGQGLNQIAAAEFLGASSWSAPQVLETVSPEQALDNPCITMNSAGNAIAMWIVEGEQGGVRASSYDYDPDPITGGWSWSEPIFISDRNVDYHSIRLAMNSAGDAVAIWRQCNDLYAGYHYVYASMYFHSIGSWTNAQVLSPDNGFSDALDVVLNDAGEAIAAWEYYDGTYHFQSSSYMNMGEQWQWLPPVNISPSCGSAMWCQLSLDGAGNGCAVLQTCPNNSFQWTSRSPTGEWSASQNIPYQCCHGSKPSFSTDGNGNGVLAWSLCDEEQYAIMVSMLQFGEWTSPVAICSADSESFAYPIAAMNHSGEAAVMWREIQTNSFEITSFSQEEWGEPLSLSDGDLWPTKHDVAIDASGNIFAVWGQAEGGEVIMASSGTAE